MKDTRTARTLVLLLRCACPRSKRQGNVLLGNRFKFIDTRTFVLL